MDLAAGQQLLHYHVVEKIGEGGMGVVWRAEDTTLGREVAIKALPASFAADAERLERFEREARVLASLNHPNIAAIHAFHERDGARFLAMELVDGEDLARRLERGALPQDDAIEIARGIASALEAAHDAGVVHRDLKPANVVVAPDGRVKVLDFGLAKARTPGAASGGDPSHSPTLTSAGTVAGMILGTAAYMSPEQARGKAVDRRADLWAFGCVLYEMLTGIAPFTGETITDILASVVKEDPDWTALPAGLSPALVRLLRRCLEKDPRRRMRDAGDARLELEDALAGAPDPSGPATVAPAPRRSGPFARMLPWAVAVVAIVAAMWSAWRPGPAETPSRLLAFDIAVPDDVRLPFDESPVVALSPGGERLVFVGLRDGVRQLFRRDLGGVDITPIAGTEGAAGPFLSPDDLWVAFFADGKLRKVPLDGGPPIDICDARNPRGGFWAPDGTIVFVPTVDVGLMRVPASGGTPEPVTVPDRDANERSHRWPFLLPDGEHVLFTVGTLDSHGDYDDAVIGLASLSSGTWRPVFDGARMAVFVAPDRLLALRGTTLTAARLDPEGSAPATDARVVLDGVGGESSSGAGYLAVASDGALVYVAASELPLERTLVRVDREGRIEPLPLPPAAYHYPKVSPDGSQLVFGIGGGRGDKDDDLWVYDLAGGGAPRRLTFDGFSIAPVWSRDGREVSFANASGIWSKRADGTAPERRVIEDVAIKIPAFVTPDGSRLVYTRSSDQLDIYEAPLDGSAEPTPLLGDPSFAEFLPDLAPDGRFMAYTSNEGGSGVQIFVRSFPDLAGKWQVSVEGGSSPMWSRDGDELYWVDRDDAIWAVAVETEPAFRAGPPRRLFKGPFDLRIDPKTNYDVTPDGRFVLVQRGERDTAARSIRVLVD